jgi:hypothetical protein
VWLIARLRAEYEPSAKVEVLKSDGTIIVRPQKADLELLQWAKRTGDQYDDVLKRLAES